MTIPFYAPLRNGLTRVIGVLVAVALQAGPVAFRPLEVPAQPLVLAFKGTLRFRAVGHAECQTLDRSTRGTGQVRTTERGDQLHLDE